jgi:hypothetical protein
MNWRLFAASVIGKAHIDEALPCQDSHAATRLGNILLAAVCDGAGSASRSELGATICTDAIIEELSQAIASLEEEGSIMSTLKIRMPDMVARVHKRLAEAAANHNIELKELACTLVGVVAQPTGGFFFHIGDGIAIAELKDAAEGGEGDECVISIPENGEYANETWFVTDETWCEHLRFTSFTGPVERLALMTDGAMPFVLDKGQRRFFTPFIEPVGRFLADVEEDEGSEALYATLASERTHVITNDDKTLLIAFTN